MTEGTVDERKRILQMVAEGKLSADEGTKLLEAVAGSERAGAAAQAAGAGARFVRIRVYDAATGKVKVNANFPVALAAIAMRFVPKEYSVNAEEVFAALRSVSSGKILEVNDEESGQRVEIVVE
jgi:hypothetical protein